ncbi:MAG: hypothetical protein R3F61_06215 [Myxococcota bacterium]
METWGLGHRILKGAIWGSGLGMLAGAMEIVALAASEKLSLGLVGFVLLGAVGCTLMAGMGLLFGVLTAPVPFVTRNARPSTSSALHLTAIGFLLCGWYLWQGAWAVYTDERAIGAFAMAAMPLGFAGVIYFNARFFLRRLEIGKPLSMPWLPAAAAGSAALVVLSAVFFAFRDTGGTYALPDERNVVIVTIDGWSHDDPPASLADGTAFDNVVTPTPESRAAAATVLTGLHPLRHRVIEDSAALSWSYITMPELLEAQAYATGAFVSSWAVNADSGLEQGFRVFDDDFSPVLGGLFRLNVLKPVAARLQLGRSGDATVDRFEGWLAGKAETPFMAWVQLPAGGDPEALVGRIEAALQAHGVVDETLLAVVGTWGEPEPGGHPGRYGLYDDTVRVRLLLRLPGVQRTVTDVPQQVRLMDVAGTAMDWLEFPMETEGVNLQRYVEGTASATVWCSLVGRTPDGSGVRVGLRNNGIKYLRDRESGAEELYHVDNDPTETRDLTSSQNETLDAARRMLATEEIALDKILGRR